MTKADQFIASQLPAILQPGEAVRHTAQLIQPPHFLLRLVLAGGLLAWFFTKAYYGVVTDRRIVLIRAPLGLFGVGYKNKGVEEIPLAQLQQIKTGGFLNNRSVTFVTRDGQKRTLRMAVWSKAVTGQRAFFDQLPAAVGNRMLPA